jgi:hypothetical protein
VPGVRPGAGAGGGHQDRLPRLGTRLPALDYKAVSGHAASFTTVFPTLVFLLLRPYGTALRLAAAAATLALGAMVAAALVHAGEHTAAEAIAGWLIGAGASVCAIYLVGDVAHAAGRQGRRCLRCRLHRHCLGAEARRRSATGWSRWRSPCPAILTLPPGTTAASAGFPVYQLLLTGDTMSSIDLPKIQWQRQSQLDNRSVHSLLISLMRGLAAVQVAAAHLRSEMFPA